MKYISYQSRLSGAQQFWLWRRILWEFLWAFWQLRSDDIRLDCHRQSSLCDLQPRDKYLRSDLNQNIPSSYLYVWNVTDNASLFYSLDKSVARTIVRDGQPQSVLRLADLNLLGSALAVGEYEVIQSDLSPQQVTHVHLVSVQRAEQDLDTSA